MKHLSCKILMALIAMAVSILAALSVCADDRTQNTILERYVPEGILYGGYPALRNQGKTGSCWAFAANTMAELSILSGESRLLDLSELHTIYFAYHPAKDPLGLIGGDEITPKGNFLNSGGNLKLAMNTLSSGKGFIEEKNMPFDRAEELLKKGIDKSLAYTSKVHLKNAYIFNNGSISIAKSMICKYGSVGLSYCDFAAFYDYDTNSYYNPNKFSTNHTVAVVGWDDNYKVKGCARPGAWLVRNSWGGSSTFSHNTYFWLSYFDQSIADDVYAFDCTSEKFYDNIYQYDGAVTSGRLKYKGQSTIKIANVYICKNQSELLKSVSLYNSEPEISYRINIYKNLSDLSNPESGKLFSTQTGKFTYEGFNNIVLKSPVTINKGERFSVVFELAKPKGDISVVYEKGENLSNMLTKPVGGRESLTYYGGRWIQPSDIGKSDYKNLRIKAYTLNVKDTSNMSASVNQLKTEITGVTNKNGKVEITWKSIKGAKYYYVYRQSGKSTGWTRIGIKKSGGSCSFTDTSVRSNTSYRYCIRIHDGSRLCDLSKTAYNIYMTPASVTSVAASKSSLNIKWKAVTGATGYLLYRKCNSKGSWQKIAAITNAGTLSYTDRNVQNGNKYTYVVRTVKDRYVSYCGCTKWTYYVAPVSITYARAFSSKTYRRIDLIWQKNTYASGYQLTYSGNSSKKTKTFRDKSLLKTYLTGLSKGTYKLAVRSYIKIGDRNYYSDWSENISMKL